jgi:hypothetical protein
MASIFTNAATARKDTRNNVIIHGEVRSIENAVLANIDAGVLYANVSSGTTMTDSNAYYYAYFDVTTDPARSDQVNYVAQYFRDLGYNVKITQNASTTDTLVWNIAW